MSKSEQDPIPFFYAASFQSPVTRILEVRLDKDDLKEYVNGILGLKKSEPGST